MDDSSALRDDLRQRDDHLPTDVLDHRQIPRDAVERTRVHERNVGRTGPEGSGKSGTDEN